MRSWVFHNDENFAATAICARDTPAPCLNTEQSRGGLGSRDTRPKLQKWQI